MVLRDYYERIRHSKVAHQDWNPPLSQTCFHAHTECVGISHTHGMECGDLSLSLTHLVGKWKISQCSFTTWQFEPVEIWQLLKIRFTSTLMKSTWKMACRREINKPVLEVHWRSGACGDDQLCHFISFSTVERHALPKGVGVDFTLSSVISTYTRMGVPSGISWCKICVAWNCGHANTVQETWKRKNLHNLNRVPGSKVSWWPNKVQSTASSLLRLQQPQLFPIKIKDLYTLFKIIHCTVLLYSNLTAVDSETFPGINLWWPMMLQVLTNFNLYRFIACCSDLHWSAALADAHAGDYTVQQGYHWDEPRVLFTFPYSFLPSRPKSWMYFSHTFMALVICDTCDVIISRSCSYVTIDLSITN